MQLKFCPPDVRYRISDICENLYFLLWNMHSIILVHFLPPGVAHTTGLSQNSFTWRLLREKTLMLKGSAMKSYVKLMRHPQHWYFSQFRCNMRKISAKGYRRAKLYLN